MRKEAVLKLTQLEKSFGSEKVLNTINLTVYRGEVIGYIGPNGAGKSTTVKLILGLIEDYEGTVELFGENIQMIDVSYKKKIGYVPETADLYENLTGYEFITFIGEMYGIELKVVEEKAKQLVKLLGLEDAYHNRIASYSKGMRQKVLLISSVLHNPDILFLDEPLSGLDANSVTIIKSILQGFAKQGKTIFYSSHIMDIVERLSDRIVLLKKGKIIADAPFEELKNKYRSRNNNLEEMFNHLTGSGNEEQIAEEFIQIVQGGENNE